MPTGEYIICCSCGRNMKSSQSPTEFDQNNRDVTSILGYVIKKNSSRGAKHGPSERQRMYNQAKQMLKKARQQKPSFTMVRQSNVQRLVVCHRVERNTQCFLTESPWRSTSTSSQELKEFNNSKHWILTINAEGPQQPLNQRPDFA